jgi:hypothetical protein
VVAQEAQRGAARLSGGVQRAGLITPRAKIEWRAVPTDGATSCTRADLDDRFTKFAQRRVTEAYRYLILDASYQEVRDDDL